MQNSHLRRAGLGLIAACSIAALAACSSSTTPAAVSTSTPEAGARVAVTYEGGILVLDATTLETIADLDSEEFTRLNPAGDGRHVMVTMSEGFQLLDTAAGTTGAPELTGVVFPADTPGHVVRHGGKTILYADGTSDTTVLETADLASSDGSPETQTIPGVEAHHGVSIVLEDGTFLTTVGNADGRTGIAATTLNVIDLPEGVEYTFRGVARGPDDLAYLIGSDGALHVLDPGTGQLTASYPVVDAWESPVKWQDPHPALTIADGTAYVTDPAADSIHAVDLATGEVVATGELVVTPNEIAVATS